MKYSVPNWSCPDSTQELSGKEVSEKFNRADAEHKPFIPSTVVTEQLLRPVLCEAGSENDTAVLFIEVHSPKGEAALEAPRLYCDPQYMAQPYQS